MGMRKAREGYRKKIMNFNFNKTCNTTHNLLGITIILGLRLLKLDFPCV